MKMSEDADLQQFLAYSSTYMDINGLGPDWEEEFRDSIQRITDTTKKLRFMRGFAKSILGQLTATEYERATGWDFDSDDAFRKHLEKYWHFFYGSIDPREVVDEQL